MKIKQGMVVLTVEPRVGGWIIKGEFWFSKKPTEVVFDERTLSGEEPGYESVVTTVGELVAHLAGEQ